MAKKTDTLLQWGGILFVLYIVSNKIAGVISDRLLIGSPRINLGAVEWSGPRPLSVAATITVPVTNENPVSFPLDRLLANVVYGNYVLTSLQISEPVVIQSGETTELQFSTYLDFANLAENVVAIVASGEYLQALKLVGSATSSGVTWPFSHTISIG